MNDLHALMAENPDPQVVATCATCLQQLAKLQSTSFQQHGDKQDAMQSVMSQLQGAGGPPQQ